jgi:GxxExxY protein
MEQIREDTHTTNNGRYCMTNTITEKILSCAYQVSNVLGAGFLESVYEKALFHELKKSGLKVESQCELSVCYDDIEVGKFFADLLVEQVVLIELKAAKDLNDAHIAQCLNYLKATRLPVCLLLNFGLPRIQIRRIML